MTLYVALALALVAWIVVAGFILAALLIVWRKD